jgi:hypothetical protein
MRHVGDSLTIVVSLNRVHICRVDSENWQFLDIDVFGLRILSEDSKLSSPYPIRSASNRCNGTCRSITLTKN